MRASPDRMSPAAHAESQPAERSAEQIARGGFGDPTSRAHRILSAIIAAYFIGGSVPIFASDGYGPKAHISIGDYDEPPDIDRGYRSQRHPSLGQSGRQRPDATKDEECRLRARAVRRRLLLVEGHCPPPAGGRQLHQRAEPIDLAARGVGCRAPRDRGATGPDGTRRPLLLRNDRDGGRGGPEGHRPCLRRCAGSRCGRGLYGAGENLSDAPGFSRHCLPRRLGPAVGGGLPARLRGRPATGGGTRPISRFSSHSRNR